MVSLNWSTPLWSSIRQRQPIELLSVPLFDGFSQECLHHDLLEDVALHQFFVEAQNFCLDFYRIHDCFFPSIESDSILAYTSLSAIEMEKELDFLVLEEPIMKDHLKSFTYIQFSDFNELTLINFFEETSISDHLQDFLPVSYTHEQFEFSLVIGIENDDGVASLHCLPVFMGPVIDKVTRNFGLTEFEIDRICYNIASSSSIASALNIKIAPAINNSSIRSWTPIETDDDLEDQLFTIEEVTLPQVSRHKSNQVDKILSANSLTNFNLKPTCCLSSLILQSEHRHKMLKHLVAQLQFYNPALPELFKVPELSFHLLETHDLHSYLNVQPLPMDLKSSSQSLAIVLKTTAWSERDVLDRIAQDIKYSMPKHRDSYRPRPDTITEEKEDELSNPLIISPIEFCSRISRSSAPCSPHFIPSPESHVRTHGSAKNVVSSSRKSSVGIRPSSCAISQCASSRQHSLEDFIALSSFSHQSNKKAIPVKFTKVEIAPSDALLDAVDLFLYCASFCTERLQIQDYLSPIENLLNVSTDSAKSIFKRAASRLRLSAQSDAKEISQMRETLQSALAFAILRNLIDILIHCGIVLCYKYLCFEIKRQDLGCILFSTSNNGQWIDCFDELSLKLGFLYDDVCHKYIRDHPKIDALLEHLQPKTVIICNHKSLVTILWIALSDEESLYLDLLPYEKEEIKKQAAADVLLVFHEDAYNDENFPWASFKKIIFYEGCVGNPGEYLLELIEAGQLCCLIFQIDEKHFETPRFNSEILSFAAPSNYSIIANSVMGDQCFDLCEKLLAKVGGVSIAWREKGFPNTSFVISTSSLVILIALRELNQMHSFISSISDLYVQYKKVTVIVVHDIDVITETDFLQVQMPLVAGLAPSKIGFQCEIVFVTCIEEIVEAVCQNLSDQVPMSNIASIASHQEQFLVEFPSINPAAAALMAQSNRSIYRLFSASLAELKARFSTFNAISIELFYKLCHTPAEQLLGIKTTSVAAAKTLSSGGDRRSPEQSSTRKRRRVQASNNHKLEDYWGPSIKRSSSSRSNQEVPDLFDDFTCAIRHTASIES